MISHHLFHLVLHNFNGSGPMYTPGMKSYIHIRPDSITFGSLFRLLTRDSRYLISSLPLCSPLRLSPIENWPPLNPKPSLHIAPFVQNALGVPCLFGEGKLPRSKSGILPGPQKYVKNVGAVILRAFGAEVGAKPGQPEPYEVIPEPQAQGITYPKPKTRKIAPS